MNPLSVRVTLTFDVIPDEALPEIRQIAEAIGRAARAANPNTIEGVSLTHIEISSSK